MAVAAGALTAAAVPSAYAASAEEAPAPLAGAWTAKLAPGSTADVGGLSCGSSTASGVDNTILSATWQCQGPLGSTGSAALSRAATFSPSSSAGGVISGSVADVIIKVQLGGVLGLCTITAAGTAPYAQFNQATSNFSVIPGTGLAVTQATNCAGLVNVGDQFSYAGTHRVTFT
ncbi:hypothetical protein ACFU6R_20475 [Streptomyces sp. NPDC057499]|uniref:hypothetical protein n=1 Tax=Streptomyces sp. NPDC057499 TaxID=3346150 RepID=UPI0036B8D4AC